MASHCSTSNHNRAFRPPLEGDMSDESSLPCTLSSTNPMNEITTDIEPVLPCQGAQKSRVSLPMVDRLEWMLFYPVRCNLENLEAISKKEITDMAATAKIMRRELLKIGSHVVALSSDLECTEDDHASFWRVTPTLNVILMFDHLSRAFVAIFWPVPETTGSEIERMYQAILRQIRTEQEKEPKPFSMTPFGRLAPEIRKKILSNLLALPPAFANHGHCVKPQDGYHFSSLDSWTSIGSRDLRVDTITSLCLEHLAMSLDPIVFGVHLMKLTSLRKICLCTGAGQERAYFEFVFNIRGLACAAVEFVDNFQWTIRSQKLLEDGRKTQHSDIASFPLQGKKFDELNSDQVQKESKLMDRESYALDVVDGDEPWVELESGSCDYEDGLSESQNSSSQEDLDAANDTLDNESIELQAQPDEGDKQEHERENMQGQQLSDNEGANTSEGPDLECIGLQKVTGGEDYYSPGMCGANQQPGTLQRPFDQDYSCTSEETFSEAEKEDLPDHIETDAEIATASDHGFETPMDLLKDEFENDQAPRGLVRFQSTDLEGLEEDGLDAELRAEMNAVSEMTSAFHDQAHQDIQIDAKDQDERQILGQPEQNVSQSSTKLGGGKDMCSKDLREIGISSNPQQSTEEPRTPPVKTNGTDVKHLSTLQAHHDIRIDVKDQDERQILGQPEQNVSQSSTKLGGGKDMCSKNLPEIGISSNPQQSTEEPKTPPAKANGTDLKRLSTLGWLTKRHLSVSIRVAMLMLALYLFHKVQRADPEDTLVQLLALVLGVLLTLMSVSSR